jgi:hypothetical protein
MEHLSRLSQLENLALHWMDKITDQGIASLAKMPSLRKLDVSSAQLTDEGLAPLTRVKTLEHVDLPSMGRTDQALMYMAQCRGLKHLWAGSASNGSYSDAGLRHLIKLQELEFLSIGGTGITDDGIVCLADLKNLKELFVFSPNLTDKSLAHLAKMESLRELTIRNSMGGDQYDVAFTIAGVSQLNTLSNLTRLKTEVVSQDNSTLRIGDMKSLESLDITPKKKRMGKKVVAERSLRDEDLACLAQLTRLKRFRDGACYLDYAYGISDAGAAHLAGLANMEDLAIGGPDLTDQALASLANMPRLNYLHIKGGHFTEKGLRHLESLQLLHTLHIKSDQSFSKEAVQRLKQALPNLGTFQLN